MKWSLQEVIIKKGKHYSSQIFRFIPFLKNKLCYDVCFTDTCLYDLNNSNNYAINKLFGFSRGFHHKNSARIGWNCLNNKIYVYAYCYIQGKRVVKKIGNLDICEIYHMSIEDLGDKYIFIIYDKNKYLSCEIQKEKTCSIGYRLFPYFGGVETAPHDIVILMNRF
jgi:hypothetical protein